MTITRSFITRALSHPHSGSSFSHSNTEKGPHLTLVWAPRMVNPALCSTRISRLSRITAGIRNGNRAVRKRSGGLGMGGNGNNSMEMEGNWNNKRNIIPTHLKHENSWWSVVRVEVSLEDDIAMTHPKASKNVKMKWQARRKKSKIYYIARYAHVHHLPLLDGVLFQLNDQLW